MPGPTRKQAGRSGAKRRPGPLRVERCVPARPSRRYRDRAFHLNRKPFGVGSDPDDGEDAAAAMCVRHLGHSSLKVTTDIDGHWERAERKLQAAKMEGAFPV
jgi:hypothetical protein